MLGASLGILLAPAGGRETRREITWVARDGRQRAARLIHRGRRALARCRDRLDPFVHATEDRVRGMREALSDTVEEARSAFNREKRGSLGQ